jgi:hypothetical protein
LNSRVALSLPDRFPDVIWILTHVPQQGELAQREDRDYYRLWDNTQCVTFINLGIVIHNVQYLVPVAAGVVYVNIIKAGLPDDAERLAKLDEKRSEEGNIQIEFGLIHGSVYTADRGHCTLPLM